MKDLIIIKPSKEYEKQAMLYIQEFKDYNSSINGTGSLYRYIDDYDGWLKYLEEKRTAKDPDSVPKETYMLIRKSDNKLIGMFNIRFKLNKSLLKNGGNIGYGIRPTERKKGYASYELYSALKICDQAGITKALVTCYKDNIGSAKTIQKCYGKKENEIVEEDGKTLQRYWINVSEAIAKLKDKYED